MEGDEDGSFVMIGIDEGQSVGDRVVGDCDGFFEGRSVGDGVVGDIDGVSEGNEEGADCGCACGCMVGLVVMTDVNLGAIDIDGGEVKLEPMPSISS